MKFRVAFMLFIGILAILCTGCEDRKIPAGSDTEYEAEEYKPEEQKAKEQKGSFQDKFCEQASSLYGMTEEDAIAMYGKLDDSKILDETEMCLTGVAFGDYDGNGETDMIVCLYRDEEDSDGYTDGCLYLFMNDDDPYYIYDAFCCYYFGNIFGDFGADIDHDGITEIVFCVQGTGAGGMGDCQKFVIKYRDNEVERMELPGDLSEEYDSGLKVEIEGYPVIGKYKIYCPYLDERIVMETEESEEVVRDRGGNCRGYYTLMMTEHEGRQLLAGYEYLYVGYTTNGVANAVFVFDWDENGKAFVSQWYVEDGKGNQFVPSDGMQREIPDDREIFSEGETGEEVTAYEEFLRGKRRAVISDDFYADTNYRETFLINKEEDGFFLRDLLDEILNEMIEDWRGDEITEVQYALIDCGNDGKKQLALRAYEVAGYYSDLKMVLDYQDGKVALIYAVDTGSTSDNEIYKNGYIFGGASTGSDCHHVWEGIIGADGIYRKSYECHIETDAELDGMSCYEDIWDTSSKPWSAIDFVEYTINDKLYYAYQLTPNRVTDEEKEKILEYIRNNEQSMGVRFLADDETWKLVEKNRERLKITDETDGEENEIEWRTLFSGWRAATAVSRTSLPEDFR